MERIANETRDNLFFLDYAPVLIASALSGENVERLFDLIAQIQRAAATRIGTGVLNRLLRAAFTETPPPMIGTRRLKLFYVAQSSGEPRHALDPPKFVLFVNQPKLLSDNYTRYIEGRIRRAEPYPGFADLDHCRARSERLAVEYKWRLVRTHCLPWFVSQIRMRSTQEITQQVQELGQWIPALREQIGHVVIGQKYLVDRLLLGLLANGHILLEGVPGLAKTLTVKTLAACIQTGFQRLQFTPDLLPADLIGTLIYNPRTGEFTTKLGPLFSNLILADEINRAPAKVQSALARSDAGAAGHDRRKDVSALRSVPGAGDAKSARAGRHLSAARSAARPLHVEAEHRLSAKAGGAADSRSDGDLGARSDACSRSSIRKQIIAAREVVNNIYIDDRVKDYIVDVVWATREPATYNLQLGRT